MYLQTLVILLSIGNTFCDFLPVSDGCKYWTYLKVYGNGDLKKVHCILDQDFQSGLVYTELKMIPKGKCPIYNRFASQIDTIPCNMNIGMCPNDTFPSYSGVTFTGCYDAIRKKTNVMKPTANENVHIPAAVSDKGNYPVGLVVIATLSASINCMFIIVCVWHFICRSKITLCRDEYGKPRRKVGKTPEQIVTQPGIGTNGECEMTRMSGDENGVPDASKLAANMYKMGSRRHKRGANHKSKPADDLYEMVNIRPRELLAYRESKPDDVKVQTDHCSRPTFDTFSQISSADSKTSEDHLVLTERGRLEDDMQLYCYLSHIK